VIAAGIGIGGTIPAATALLRAIARDLPAGAVVLHGIDRLSAEQVWDAVQDAPTHPFGGQHRLLAALGAARRDIAPWPGCAQGAARGTVPEGRPELLGMALRPAAGLPAWQARRPHQWAPALAGLSRLEAPDAQAEAVAIALLLREALEDPEARAALVTPDRDLARRVSAELARHGVACDDSAGEPLGETGAGAFLRLIARMVAEDFAPVPLLSVMKHPLASGGMDRVDWVRLVRRLERAALRGPRPGRGLAGIHAAVAAAFAGKREDAEAQAALAGLLGRFAACLGEFTALPAGPALPPADLLAAHLAAAEALAATPDRPGALRLYAGEEGEVLAGYLAGLPPALAQLGPVAPSAWPALFDAMLEGAASPSFRGSRGREDGPHPRVEILGLLEARLLTFDRVVLGALDESIWPLATDPGPWMSRPMRKQFGLPEPEARIGRVCADFLLSACGAPVAVLSRAGRRGGQPTVPARWLTRIETFLRGQTGAAHPQGLRLAASPAVGWAALLDQPGEVRPCPRPAPRPPLAARPRRLSVTAVATLLADPYAFHARHVLRLAPLDPLDAEPDAADYGMLVHAVLAGFLRALPDGHWPGAAAAAEAFDRAAAAALAESGARPGLVAFWRPRLARIRGFVLEQEALLRAPGRILRSHAEVPGKVVLHAEGRDQVTLEARADRIDLLADGSLAILDYKTGGVPTGPRIRGGEAAQLPLEAAIAARGGFDGVPEALTSAALYWRLTGGFEPGKVADAGALLKRQGGVTIQDEAETAWAAARALAKDYLLGTRPFTARPHPARRPAGSDYDHLARLGEWAGAQEATGEGA
jgi:ATP-dependent helicase/nuclease subunit B